MEEAGLFFFFFNDQPPEVDQDAFVFIFASHAAYNQYFSSHVSRVIQPLKRQLSIRAEHVIAAQT